VRWVGEQGRTLAAAGEEVETAKKRLKAVCVRWAIRTGYKHMRVTHNFANNRHRMLLTDLFEGAKSLLCGRW